MRITIPDQRPSTLPARIRMTQEPVVGIDARSLPGVAVSSWTRFAVRRRPRIGAYTLPVRLLAPATGGYGCSVSAVDNFAGGARPVASITGKVSGVPPRGRPV